MVGQSKGEGGHGICTEVVRFNMRGEVGEQYHSQQCKADGVECAVGKTCG